LSSAASSDGSRPDPPGVHARGPTSAGGQIGAGAHRDPESDGFINDATGGIYKWVGPVITEPVQDLIGELGVVRTGNPHDTEKQFHTVVRLMVRRPNDVSHWFEAGWGEMSFENNHPYVYTFSSVDQRGWQIYSYAIEAGDRPYFWLYFNGCNVHELCDYDAWMWWNGKWNYLAWSGPDNYGNPYPVAEVMTEMYKGNPNRSWWSITRVPMRQLAVIQNGTMKALTDPPIDSWHHTGWPYCATYTRAYDDLAVQYCQ
jgi:hypothetical protein